MKYNRIVEGHCPGKNFGKPRLLERTHYQHMKSVMNMRSLKFIYIYMSTYEIVAEGEGRCVVLGNAETTCFLGLVSDMYVALQVLLIRGRQG